MPYIVSDERQSVVTESFPTTDAGFLNYQIHQVIAAWMEAQAQPYRIRYADINTIIGVLECVKLELYRRIAGPYEDAAMKRNGDVEPYETLCRE